MHKRARLLLALFFGTLSILFGTSVAQAATPVPGLTFVVGGYEDQNYGSGMAPDLTQSTVWRVTQSFVDNYKDYSSFSFNGCVTSPPTSGYEFQSLPNTNTCDYSDVQAGDYVFYNRGDNYIAYDANDFVGNFNLFDPAYTGYTFDPTPPGGTPSPPPASSGDPLNGQGMLLVSSTVNVFTTYIVPAVVLVLVSVYAFRMIARVGTRFLNRA